MKNNSLMAAPFSQRGGFRIAVLLTLLAVHFLMGCDPNATEHVFIQLPTVSEGVEITKHAVKVIDEVLKQQSFERSRGTHTNAQYLASYVYSSNGGNLTCYFYHHTEELELRFGDFGRTKSRPEAIKIRDAVRKRLIEEFGKDKVR